MLSCLYVPPVTCLDSPTLFLLASRGLTVEEEHSLCTIRVQGQTLHVQGPPRLPCTGVTNRHTSPHPSASGFNEILPCTIGDHSSRWYLKRDSRDQAFMVGRSSMDIPPEPHHTVSWNRIQGALATKGLHCSVLERHHHGSACMKPPNSSTLSG